MNKFTFIVIGGGVAGTTCAERVITQKLLKLIN